MDGYSIVSGKFSNTFFYDFSGTFEVVIIEIKPDKYISWVESLNNPHCVTPKSEGAVNHDILLCRAQIQAVNVLMEEYRNMSKTFFVQIVKKWWMGNKIFPFVKLFFFPLLSTKKVYFIEKIYWQISNNIREKWRVFNIFWTIKYFFVKKSVKNS